MEAAEGLAFDILAIHAGCSVRIQTKSTQTCKNERYSFITAKGRYATTTKHGAPLTIYTESDTDLVAFVALPIERVIFMPVTAIKVKTVTLLNETFLEDGMAGKSFTAGLKALKFI